MQAHLLIFDPKQIDKKVVVREIAHIESIKNWYAFFDNVLSLASEEDAKTLVARVRARLPELRFIVTAVRPEQKGGLMPKSVWSFLNEPTAVETETA